ncbi:MAG: hypothetical protein E7269_05790 [Lachnospiraceae bacterium]|nr:hypothetical protein [Lachnospiraceae bacterium]
MEEDFDHMISNRQIEMLKTVIPYLPYSRQRTLSMIVKITELKNTIQYFRENEQANVKSCSEDFPENRIPEMLNAIKVYCSKQEQEQIDFIFQMLMAIQMMQES